MHQKQIFFDKHALYGSSKLYESDLEAQHAKIIRCFYRLF